MVNFLYQIHWAKWCPGVCFYFWLFLGVSVGVSLEDVSSWISGFWREDGLPWCEGLYSTPEINKRWRKRELAPSQLACMTLDIALLLPLDRHSPHRPLVLRPPDADLNSSPRFPRFQSQMADYPPASSCEPIPCNKLHVSPVLVLFLWRTLTDIPFSGSDPYYPTWTRSLDLG